MRNPDRIDPFLERLGKVWKKVPDWRFRATYSKYIKKHGPRYVFP